MTPFKIPEPPYTIEGIMQELENQYAGDDGAREAIAPETAHLVASLNPGEAERLLLEKLERARAVEPSYQIRSHRRLVGFFIDPIKRFLHWGTRPYVRLLIEKQEQFNHAATEAMRYSLARVPLADKVPQIESELREVERAGKVSAEFLSELSRHQAEINQSLQNMFNRLSADVSDFMASEQRRHATQEQLNESQEKLNETLIEISQVLQARHDLGPFFKSLPEEKRIALLDRLRGPFGEIWGRHHAYLEYFRNRPGLILDVGCGRGEFLHMLRMEGIGSWGCEIDSLMIDMCKKKELTVKEMDALQAVESVPPASLGGIFSSQVIEHMFPGDLLNFLRLAREKIAPGGVLVMETLNPQSLAVLSKSYYKDLDHKRAVDPDYLAALVEAVGFKAVESRRTMPFGEKDKLPDLPEAETIGLHPEARRTLQTIVEKLNAAIWADQDCHVVAEVPGLNVSAAASATAATVTSDRAS